MGSSGFHSLGQFSTSTFEYSEFENELNMANRESDPQSAGAETPFPSMRMAGFLAMHNPQKEITRCPTDSRRAGYGISHTSPTPLTDNITPSRKEQDEVSNFPSRPAQLNTSNFIDNTPAFMMNRIVNNKWPDLPTLLTSIGCETYITLFNSRKVDLATFASIDEKDLITLGVNVFSYRRRMLLAIAELNKREATPGQTSETIGSKKTTILAEIFKNINFKVYSIATRQLLDAIFTKEELATHSMSGRPSPAYIKATADYKPPLDQTKISDIIEEVVRRCNVPDAKVRQVITAKCADEGATYKKRQ